ncbi:MAG TPA: hypothetical protein VMY34_00655 [Acidimicrobiales bacterium]|nr:hypothetical protein [Acidimicrobiales bacterium]
MPRLLSRESSTSQRSEEGTISEIQHESEAAITVVDDIEVDEWAAVAERVAPFATQDEAEQLGHLEVRGDGAVRTWRASDGEVTVTYATPSDTEVAPTLMPLRVARVGRYLAIDGDDVALAVGSDFVTVSDGETSLTMHAHDDVLIPAAHVSDEPAWVDARVSTAELFLVAHEAAFAPPGVDDDDEEPAFWLSVEPATLRLSVGWETGAVQLSCPAEATAAARVSVNARLLARIAATVEVPDVVLRVPVTPQTPLVVIDGRWTATLEAKVTGAERHRAELEVALGMLVEEDEVVRGGDGDYVILPPSREPIHVRLLDTEPPLVSVFSVLVAGVEPKATVLRELNDLNAELGLVRVALRNGQVHAIRDLAAAGILPCELQQALDTVAAVTTRLGPLLRPMFRDTPARGMRPPIA